MMQLVRCQECGNSNIPIGTVSVDVQFHKRSWCDKCNQSTTANRSFFFCNPKCFTKYMTKVIKGKAKLEFHE